MLMRILVFAFYLDHWWCEQPNFSGDFVYTNFQSTSYGQIYLDGAPMDFRNCASNTVVFETLKVPATYEANQAP